VYPVEESHGPKYYGDRGIKISCQIECFNKCSYLKKKNPNDDFRNSMLRLFRCSTCGMGYKDQDSPPGVTQATMLKALVAAALVALVAADGIPDFVAPGTCAKVANQNNFDLHRVSCLIKYCLLMVCSLAN